MTGVTPPTPFVFIITGEPSGDALGGALIAALRQRVGDGLRVAGIGGERMREQGVDSLAPLSEFAVNGIAEVLPRRGTSLFFCLLVFTTLTPANTTPLDTN